MVEVFSGCFCRCFRGCYEWVVMAYWRVGDGIGFLCWCLCGVLDVLRGGCGRLWRCGFA